MIVDIIPSPLKAKRYRVIMDTGQHYDFGYKYGSTYIDHKNTKIRRDYIKRHYANPTERELIDNLVPSPALFAAYLLWGPYDTLDDNIVNLNNLWEDAGADKLLNL